MAIPPPRPGKPSTRLCDGAPRPKFAARHPRPEELATPTSTQSSRAWIRFLKREAWLLAIILLVLGAGAFLMGYVDSGLTP